MTVQNDQIYAYKHSGNSGDIIYSLPGIQNLWKQTGIPARMHIWINQHAHYYQGAVHPVTSDDVKGQQVMMNMYMFSMIQPLLAAQPYFDKQEDSVTTWTGQEFSVDLDRIRVVCMDNPMPYHNIAKWYWMCYPDMQCDLSEKWLHVEPDYTYKDHLIVNRTFRYLNRHIEYFFLKKKGYPCAFSGTKLEFEVFQNQWQMDDLVHLQPNNFYHLASWMAGAKGFLGNQSMGFAIAEGLKIPRVVEICNWAPNVDPAGKDGYLFLHQGGVEWAVKKIMGY